MHTAPRRIILTGFMGAGKTTVGALLEPVLGWAFFDTDAILCERTGTTVAELFASRGESYFRAIEADLIAELTQHEKIILALGGGALEHPDTLRRVTDRPDSLLVYLETTLELSLQRCAGGAIAPVRPVLADREALEQRFRNRLPLYRHAGLVLPTAGKSPQAIAQEIAAAIRRES